MKLWLLRPQNNLPDDDNPWKPWYDKSFGFVIRAENKKEARQLADKEAGDENSKTKTPWLDPKYSTCLPLTKEGKSEIIIQDFYSA